MSSSSSEHKSDPDEKLSSPAVGADSDDDATVVKYDAGVDVALLLMEAHSAQASAPLDPAVANRLRRKIDWHILPLLFALYTMNAIDKSTLGSSAILGIMSDCNLTTDQWNNLGSAFYIGYIIAEYPQVYALQRLPVGKWIGFNIFLWAVFLGLQATCKSYGGLFALRLLLGASEAVITSGLMLITSMFYTRLELASRIGWSFQSNGVAMILIGFLSFGVAHTSPNPLEPTARPAPWQWLVLITAVGTVLVCAAWVWGMPDNPVGAGWLDEGEKVDVVRRVKGNQTGIETKVWKRSQLVEALTDYKTWIFFFMVAIADLQNGISVQYSLIIEGFGFTTIQSTVLNVPSGFTQIIGVTSACLMLRFFPNSRSLIAILWFLPAIAGAIGLLTIPLSNSVGLLVSYYILQLGGAPSFVMMLSWVTVLVSGHTKKLATNGIFLMGYALGQIVCTQFWKSQYRPRDTVPWAIILVAYCVVILLILLLRTLLIRENARRDALQEKGGDEYGWVEQEVDGEKVRLRVEKRLLDMTDRENLAFRYPL